MAFDIVHCNAKVLVLTLGNKAFARNISMRLQETAHSEM